MNNLINTNTAPTEPGPMVLLVLFTDSNQFYSQQNMKIQYKLQSQLYAGCSINALMHIFTNCTRSFMLEQTVCYVCMLYISIDLAEQFSFSSILKTKSKTKPKQKIKCSMVLLLI